MQQPKTILEQLFFTTVRIACKDNEQNESMGTGFLYNYTEKKIENYLYLVTCKHVIERAQIGVIFLNQEKDDKLILGNYLRIVIDDFENKWIKNEKYDIAIMPISIILNYYIQKGFKFFLRPFSKDIIPTREIIEKKIDAIEDVLFVGYPNDIYDKKNMLPVIRKGISASPISVDFEGEPKFLIDASIFPGSSGSPVLICNAGSFTHKGSGLSIGNRIFLLGVVSSVYILSEENVIEEINVPAQKQLSLKTSQMIDLGIVYKSNIVKEMVEEHISKIKAL